VADEVKAVGYVGLGLMGGPMAVRLARAGYRLSVWNRSAEKLKPAIAAGAVAVASPAEAARASEVVFVCLTDTDAVEAMVFGPGGIAEGGAPGKVLVDMSTIKPDRTAQMAERLRRETGMGWLDAPVSGGVPGATSGALAVMAGGSEADFRKVEPVVAHLARGFTLMGPNGAGQNTKLINQIIVGCTIAMLAEATGFALAAGIDATKVPVALAGGRADSLCLQQFMPRMATGDYTVESQIDTMLKDLNVIQETARNLGAAVPMSSLSAELHRMMAHRGHGGEDNTAMVKLFKPGETV
jgi:3-hydroxyisobutyrate dehydrogenase